MPLILWVENLISSGKLKEETEDSLKDKRMERGGVDGNVRYDQKPRVKTGPVNKEKAMEKRKKALDFVKNSISFSVW